MSILHKIRTILAVAGLGCAAQIQVSAFSMLGDYGTDDTGTVWQVVEIGYNIDGDLGGPMNIGEEYRYNVPLLAYAFDQSFLNYFGPEGVRAVEQGIAVFNDLPAASAMSPTLSEFPLDSRQVNHRANQLNLLNVRPFIMQVILEELGVAASERFVWTLRARTVINDIPFYTVISRNFDPITWRPSAYVNENLYTYTISQTSADPDIWEAIPIQVDPLGPGVTTLASFASGGTIGGLFSLGQVFSGVHYTGLTRDDAGALRYMYRPDNFNVETLPPNTSFLSGGIGSSPFVVPGIPVNNGNPWLPPLLSTNLFNTNQTPGAVFTNIVAPVDISLRGGIDKINFVPMEYDSVFGQNLITMTNSYTDVYISNNVAQAQVLSRVINFPDIIFTAADLGVTGNLTPVRAARSFNFVNNDAINGFETLSGPGVIVPPVVISLSNVGPYFSNTGDTSQEDGFRSLIWASFDGSTNEPIIFPVGTRVRDIERLVLGR